VTQKKGTAQRFRCRMILCAELGGRSHPEASRNLSSVPPAEVSRGYHGKNPFVLKNKIAHWAASGLWTPDYLSQQYGDVTVALEVGRACLSELDSLRSSP
jgi:hypothetical protein